MCRVLSYFSKPSKQVQGLMPIYIPYAENQSPRSLLTRIRLSAYCTLKRKSYKKTTFWPLYSALLFGAPDLLSQFMLHCQGKSKKWSMNWRVTLLQTSTHRMSGNWTCCKHVHYLINGPCCGYTVLQMISQCVSSFGRYSWEGIEILYAAQYNPQKSITSISTWQ